MEAVFVSEQVRALNKKSKFFMFYDKRTFRFTAKQWFPELYTSNPPLKFIYLFFNLSKNTTLEIFSQIYIYTGCPRRNGENFGRVFLMLNYTDITQNTYIQS